MNIRTTQKLDIEGKEIFEGDKVLKAWSWFRYLGEQKTGFQIHTITVKDAHEMANGEMHDDGDGVIFCLGKTYNFWKSGEVKKLSEDEVNEINMPDDTMFFFGNNNKAVQFTDKHFMNMTDEKWEEYKKVRDRKMFEHLFKTN